MRTLMMFCVLSWTALAQPVLQELPAAEAEKWTRSLSQTAFRDHDECLMIHQCRLLRVNGRLHGLALHRANLHGGRFSWMHYLWDGSRWKPVGPGLPDPKSDVNLVLPEPSAEEIQTHFKALVQGLQLQEWPKPAQQKLLDADKIKEL